LTQGGRFRRSGVVGQLYPDVWVRTRDGGVKMKYERVECKIL